jgi:PAS domain S-box-containing protein
MTSIVKIGSPRLIAYLLIWAAVTVVTVIFLQNGFIVSSIIAIILWVIFFRAIYQISRRNVKKVALMFDSIDNADYAFKFATNHKSSDDLLVNTSLNRIIQVLLQNRNDAMQREKYYELIINSVNTGIIVLDDRGNVYQTNREVLRLLGLPVFTHVSQLHRIDSKLEQLIEGIQPRGKNQISFSNERGVVHLSVHASGMKLGKSNMRIIAINDINRELDENEIDSWVRIIRVLTHEIMNSLTPVISLSDTLLEKEKQFKETGGVGAGEIFDGLVAINKTCVELTDFVENYRKFTNIPTPVPSLFFVKEFCMRMEELLFSCGGKTACYDENVLKDIDFEVNVRPDDLILYADEKLVSRVMLNILKNAVQAIGISGGKIQVEAYCAENEAVFIDVINNGPVIPDEEMDHIFVPFFTTKENGSGIGLSVSRQIMRLSGGTITVKSDAINRLTTFSLMFP